MDGTVEMVARDPQDPRDLLDHQVHQDILDHQEHQEIQEHQEYQQVLSVTKEEQEVHRDQRENLDLKDKRDKQGRGCLESVTCAGAGQVVMEMLRLFTQESLEVVITTTREAVGNTCVFLTTQSTTDIVTAGREQAPYMELSMKLVPSIHSQITCITMMHHVPCATSNHEVLS